VDNIMILFFVSFHQKPYLSELQPVYHLENKVPFHPSLVQMRQIPPGSIELPFKPSGTDPEHWSRVEYEKPKVELIPIVAIPSVDEEEFSRFSFYNPEDSFYTFANLNPRTRGKT